MNRSALLAAAYGMDLLLGDPEWFPHPVRIMGQGIARGEQALRWTDQPAGMELACGALLALGVVAGSYWLTRIATDRAYRISEEVGAVTELLLGWTCLAARSLEQESTAVVHALEQGDLVPTRRRLARIVGRDTDGLDEAEIARATIETVAESACDGVVAPLFYLALGGVPLAMAYKAVNTLDSMIGHADERYFYFGKTAARLDDAANLLPARMTAALLCGACCGLPHADAKAAWRTWRRDGALHKSPNAGQPESAMAGALHAQLGGANTYAGERVDTSVMGREFRPPTPSEARSAIRLMRLASLLGLATAVIVTACVQLRGRGR